jgi:hypothetical protein
MNKFIVPILLSLVLTACGGGGGGSGSSSPAQSNQNAQNSQPTQTTDKVLIKDIQMYVNTIYNTAVGDLNGDGLEDVVVGGWYFDSPIAKIWVLTQNADGTLTDSTQAILGTTSYFGSQHIFIADFDNDGKNDIWLPGFRDGSTEVPANSTMFWGTGSNTRFTRQLFSEQTEAHGACIDDVNNDGKLDMIVADSGPDGGIYINQGNRNFVLNNTILGGNNYFSSCAVSHQANGDVNILLTNNNALQGYADNINVYDSSMNFKSFVGVPAIAGEGVTIDSLAVDVNADGIKDFILAHNAGNARDVWLNTGNSTYAYDKTLDTQGNDYYSYTVTVNGNPMILMAGNNVGTRLYQINNGLSVYRATAFPEMANGAWAQSAAVYRNSTSGKSYMLQLLDTNFYIKELQ